MKQAINHAIPSLAGNLLQRSSQEQTLKRLSLDYLIDEIGSVIEAREIKTLEAYQATPRTGREISFNKTQRQAIWHVRDTFYQLLAQQNLQTWHQTRNRALDILRSIDNPPIYDAVVIDEAQDLGANTLRILTQLCRQPNRLFITADANQSIYGSSFRWSDVHQDLKFVGHTGVLRVNHRTTKEINEAALTYLNYGAIDELEREYIHNGPALEAHFMSSKELDLNKQGVKVITLKAAKGLEFPIVAIAGFLDAAYPTIPKNTQEDETIEILARERRTLFVGMTRAMRALLIITPATGASSLLEFDSQLWNLGNS
jgi:superfamily I DNA/RNA helicase